MANAHTKYPTTSASRLAPPPTRPAPVTARAPKNMSINTMYMVTMPEMVLNR